LIASDCEGRNPSKKLVADVGPLEMRFRKRLGFSGARVLGDEVLLAVVPMEDLHLAVSPKTLEVNPGSPNVAAFGVK
jgi:hypothetical protein